MEFLGFLLVLGAVGLLVYFFDSRRDKANPYRQICDTEVLNDTQAHELSILLQERFPRLQVLVREILPQLKVVVPQADGSSIELQVEVSSSTVTVWNEGNSERIYLRQGDNNWVAKNTEDAGIERVIDYFDRKLILQDLTLELGLEGPSHWESWEDLDGDEGRVIEFIEDFESRTQMGPVEAEILAENIVFSLDCLLDSGASAGVETKAVVEFIKKNASRFPLTIQSWLNRSEKEYPAVAVVKDVATKK